MSQSCSCPLTYQGKQYTVGSLNTTNNNCACNGTTCGCCVSEQTIFQITEKKCSAKDFRSVCSSCASNGTMYNCSDCTTVDSLYTLLGQSYFNVKNESCLCRGPGTSNCTCCLAQKPALPAQP